MTLSNQEIFTKVKNHLLQQGCKSLDHSLEEPPRCRYRGAFGTKCAIGCLIPDDQYQSQIEGKGVVGLFRDFAVQMQACGLSYKEHFSLLIRLQGIHDHQKVGDWPKKLKEAAADFDLDFSL